MGVSVSGVPTLVPKALGPQQGLGPRDPSPLFNFILIKLPDCCSQMIPGLTSQCNLCILLFHSSKQGYIDVFGAL